MQEFTILRGQRTIGRCAGHSTHGQGEYAEFKEFVHWQPFA
jgi:alpha/beta superfamily hydrolase